MQNLSLQMTQTAPLKNLADAAKKSDASADKPASGEANTPFQMVLSKQVQAKQTSAKQVSTKPVSGEHVAAEQKNKSKASNVQSNTSQKEGAGPVDGPGTMPRERVELDLKALFAVKEDADTAPEDAAINAADTTSIALASAISVTVMNVPPVSTQGSSAIASANADSPPTTTLEAVAQKQQSLDAVLNNALSQGKNTNMLEKDAQNAGGDIGDGKMASEHARWLDVILPGVARQAASDESTSAKLMPNVIKDSISKDTPMPASYQPVAQVSAALPLQQAGSTNTINAYPGKSGWDQAISQKVMWMVGVGEQSVSLTLNPPDMGPLQVVIHVHNDQADATFISDNTEVRQALEDGMSNLRDKMSESGIQLGQANVSSGGQSQQEFQQAMQNRLAAQQNNSSSASTVEQVASSAATVVRVGNGLVDTFA
jgi:flagellar hook-length control protein FliK